MRTQDLPQGGGEVDILATTQGTLHAMKVGVYTGFSSWGGGVDILATTQDTLRAMKVGAYTGFSSGGGGGRYSCNYTGYAPCYEGRCVHRIFLRGAG